jgi:septal ring factor EnvC (AmiA/AmiB activator)
MLLCESMHYLQAEARAAEAFMAREEAQSAMRVAQSETRTTADSLASLQRSSDAAAADLCTAQAALKEAKQEVKKQNDALEKIREELATVYARAHSAEVCFHTQELT